MNISAETFADIISSLRSERKTNDRRGKPRVGLSGRAAIQFEGKSTTVMVRDLSQTGICIMQARPLKEAARFTLCFNSSARDGRAKGMICEVVRSVPVTDSLFAIGARFVQEVDLAQAKPPQKKPKSLDDMMREMQARASLTTPR
jgi:hypothetical protein